MKSDNGTTYFGFLFKEGIILASFSDMSAGTSLAPKTIFEINQHMLSTMLGGEADKLFQKECVQYEIENKRRISAEQASIQLSDIMGTISYDTEALVVGWEPWMGPHLYLVDNYDFGYINGPFFWIRPGSGLSDLFDLHESCAKRNLYNMSICEAVSFAQWVIRLGASEDGARDGFTSVYHVGHKGWKKMFGADDVVKRCRSYIFSPNTVDQKMTDDDEIGNGTMAEAARAGSA